MFARVVVQELGISCVQFQLNWFRSERPAYLTPNYWARLSFLHDLLTSEGRELHPQILWSIHQFACAEACGLVTPAQQRNVPLFIFAFAPRPPTASAPGPACGRSVVSHSATPWPVAWPGSSAYSSPSEYLKKIATGRRIWALLFSLLAWRLCE